MEKQYQSYREFWPFYLNEHQSKLNRGLHFIRTALAISLFATAFIHQYWMLLLAVPIGGYAFAWIGHFIVEKNRPATITYPLWSLRGDFHMFFLILLGRLDKEIAVLKSAKTSR